MNDCCSFILAKIDLLVAAIYYFGFAKKENGKTAKWQLPFSRLAV
jgi:hypothetical protein